MQYRQATEKYANLSNADKWLQRLESEYQQLIASLQLWAQHQQSWYEAKSSELHEKWSHWERQELRDSYREAKFKLKVQRQRWRDLVENYSTLSAINPA